MMIQRLKNYFEENAFGVCAYLGDKIGLASSKIRFFFIYASFLALGSPIIVYLALAFVINIKNYIKNRSRNPVWYS